MPGEILIIAFLLLLNGFFALSEMAIVSSSKPLLRQYAKQGSKSAERALALAENPGRFLSTVQVGITLVGILAGAYGGATIAGKLTEPLNDIPFIYPRGEGVAVFLVVASITYFSVVIGELVPKQFALNNSEKMAMFVARPMSFLSFLCTPIVALLEFSAKAVMALLRIKPRTEGMTENEIQAVIAEGAASGAIEPIEHDAIRRIIRLGDRDVKSIMTHRSEIVFVNLQDSLDQVKVKILNSGHSRYPVTEDDSERVIGVIEPKSILARLKTSDDFQVKDYLQDILFVSERTTCLAALNMLKTQSMHMAAIVDEYGSLEGIFTVSDMMEAIVGTIPSNYDEEEGPMIVEREDAASWLVDGLTPIDEVRVVIGLDEIQATNDYQTIAGFVLNNIKSSPTAGVWFDFSGYRFEIVDMDRHRIDKILIARNQSAT